MLIEDVAPEHLQSRCRLQCGGVACEGVNGMPSIQRLGYEFAPLRARGADDEDSHFQSLSRCREPSWLENIELRAKKAIKYENIDQDILIFDGCLALELQVRLSRIGIRTLFSPLGSSHPNSRQKRWSKNLLRSSSPAECTKRLE